MKKNQTQIKKANKRSSREKKYVLWFIKCLRKAIYTLRKNFTLKFIKKEPVLAVILQLKFF
tara:strand:- start:411 stop:593 length:183 start_codon:yes stop_codon:yes gene_type:complete